MAIVRPMRPLLPKRPMRPKYVATKLLFYEAAKPTSNRRPESKNSSGRAGASLELEL